MNNILEATNRFVTPFLCMLGFVAFVFIILACVALLVLAAIGVAQGKCPFWYIPVLLVTVSFFATLFILFWVFISELI